MDIYSIFFIILFVLLLMAIMLLWHLCHKVKALHNANCQLRPQNFEPFFKMDITDVVKLVNTDYIEQLEVLVRRTDVESILPAFYKKYLKLRRTNQEKYFQSLVEVLGRDKQDYINNLLDNHPDVSTSEILLLLLLEAGADNKTIARLLFIQLASIKKRKSRLRSKLRAQNGW